MKTYLRIFCAAFAASALLFSQAHAALITSYDFDSDPVGALADLDPITGTGASGNGEAHIDNGTITIVNDPASGVCGVQNANPGNYAVFSGEGGSGTNQTGSWIDTGFDPASNGIADLTLIDYTASAWVRFDNQSGDNMVFGSLGQPGLHLGSRDPAYHSGHWGDDLVSGTATDVGNWHHVTWTNDTTGLQEIFVDGALVSSGAAGGGGIDDALNLIIGSAPNNGGFAGALDDVRIYTGLPGADGNPTLDELTFIEKVPEPTGFALFGAALMAMFALRRKR